MRCFKKRGWGGRHPSRETIEVGPCETGKDWCVKVKPPLDMVVPFMEAPDRLNGLSGDMFELTITKGHQPFNSPGKVLRKGLKGRYGCPS